MLDPFAEGLMSNASRKKQLSKRVEGGPPGELNAFRTALTGWFRKNQRDLPWRRDRTLYRTVVSEFMLQQTRVETVLPYFSRWMHEFPDFKTLAERPEERVMKRWEGLGYYSRARNLHALAKVLADVELPPVDTGWWETLPGVGPYTAAAIVSLSFNTPAACVDGNVVRILARVAGDNTRFTSGSEAVKKYRPRAARLLDPKRPGEHNEAMMELGATVCVRTNPKCSECPIARWCHACVSGNPERFPGFRPRTTEKRSVNRAWCRDRRGRVLLYQTDPDARRLAALWELPTLEQIGITGRKARSKGDVIMQAKRSITRFSITETIYRVDFSSGQAAALNPDHPGLAWKGSEEISSLTFSGPHRRWIEKLLDQEDSSRT